MHEYPLKKKKTYFAMYKSERELIIMPTCKWKIHLALKRSLGDLEMFSRFMIKCCLELYDG
jgi:hypothetical protein